MSAHLNISKRRRAAIYRRDSHQCVWCLGHLCFGTDLTLDHVVPRAHGGTDATRNLVTAGLRCNSARGSKSLLAFARIIADDVPRHWSWSTSTVVMRVLGSLELPILLTPGKRSARKQRGQLSMILQEGALR